jgi:ABC transport system ATP-binding/permease protein
VVAIYILIPVLLIPQLLLSGIIVKFDKLNNWLKSDIYVPAVGDVMASRWAYEALSVAQFKDNAYEAPFYEIEKVESDYTYCTNYWIPEILNRLGACELYIDDSSRLDYLKQQLPLLHNEIDELANFMGIKPFYMADALSVERFNSLVATESKSYVKQARSLSSAMLDRAIITKDDQIKKIKSSLRKNMDLVQLKDLYHNKSLADQVLNRTEDEQLTEIDHHLLRKYEPVFLIPKSPYGRSQFYAPVKRIGHIYIDTYWFNMIVLWLMCIALYITLAFDVLKRIIQQLKNIQLFPNRLLVMNE